MSLSKSVLTASFLALFGPAYAADPAPFFGNLLCPYFLVQGKWASFDGVYGVTDAPLSVGPTGVSLINDDQGYGVCSTWSVDTGQVVSSSFSYDSPVEVDARSCEVTPLQPSGVVVILEQRSEPTLPGAWREITAPSMQGAEQQRLVNYLLTESEANLILAQTDESEAQRIVNAKCLEFMPGARGRH